MLKAAIAIEAFHSVANTKVKETSISKISWLVIDVIWPVAIRSNSLVKVEHMRKLRKLTWKKIRIVCRVLSETFNNYLFSTIAQIVSKVKIDPSMYYASFHIL